MPAEVPTYSPTPCYILTFQDQHVNISAINNILPQLTKTMSAALNYNINAASRNYTVEKRMKHEKVLLAYEAQTETRTTVIKSSMKNKTQIQ